MNSSTITVTQNNAFVATFDLSPTATGPLDGLRFAIKDTIDVAGFKTGCGNLTWRDSHPAAVAHAVCVEQFLRAGARCVGKTISDELALSLLGENYFYGTPLNPRAPERIPGGSSSGSASAVAGGEVDFALGTDTAGSVRVPAANCGIFGFRPTWGRSSMAGIQPLASSFDTLGLFARDPALLVRIAGSLSPFKAEVRNIGAILILHEAWALADPEIQEAGIPLKDHFKQAGLSVETIGLNALADGDLGEDIFSWKQTFSGAQWPEVWSTYGGWLTHANPELGPKIAENF